MEQPTGTIIFSTIGRTQYGFDVFSTTTEDTVSPTTTNETLLTDGISINFNAHFISSDQLSIVYISERTGSPQIYRTGSSLPLVSIPNTLFLDRPTIHSSKLYFVSAHEHPNQSYKSWSAVYSAEITGDPAKITRLTPPGFVDYSPSVSYTGEFVAVASYGSRTWEGEFQELKTDVVVFRESEPAKRVVVCERGGWPTWSGDSAIYFHRLADDGWWSIYQVHFPGNLDVPGFPNAGIRITPPGVHCFTPAAMHDGKRIAVATRRRGNKSRHIELFDVESKTFYPITEPINPNFHHYNPFVSRDSTAVGYHRFRGESTLGETRIPHLERVASPVKDLKMLRINGFFPAFSPAGDLLAINTDLGPAEADGGLKVVKSDGSKRWTLLKGRVAFCNSWSPTEKHVIYTSVGPIFESPKTAVQIARVAFDPSDLKGDHEEISCDVKILTREDTGNNAFPACSPDGKSLVFRSGRSGHKNLYILDAVNGEFDGGIRQLTEGPWIDTMPSWSPNGELIAFSSNMHNPDNVTAFSIYLIKSDGSGLRRVHVAGEEGSTEVDRERINHVCFSRDGEWLLFTANLSGVTAGEPIAWPNQFQPYGDMFVVRLDGSGLKRLTCNGYENGTPAWHHNEVYLGTDVGEVGEVLKGKIDEPVWLSSEI